MRGRRRRRFARTRLDAATRRGRARACAAFGCPVICSSKRRACCVEAPRRPGVHLAVEYALADGARATHGGAQEHLVQRQRRLAEEAGRVAPTQSRHFERAMFGRRGRHLPARPRREAAQSRRCRRVHRRISRTVAERAKRGKPTPAGSPFTRMRSRRPPRSALHLQLAKLRPARSDDPRALIRSSGGWRRYPDPTARLDTPARPRREPQRRRVRPNIPSLAA